MNGDVDLVALYLELVTQAAQYSLNIRISKHHDMPFQTFHVVKGTDVLLQTCYVKDIQVWLRGYVAASK